MPKPAAYKVTVTGVRNYKAKKPATWNFSQMVWSQSGAPGALVEFGKKFFNKWFKGSGIRLPSGTLVKPGELGKLRSYVISQQPDNKGNYLVQTDKGVLEITRLRAMSGDTPKSLYPSDPEEYAERLQQNVTAYDWWIDPIVQIPAPVIGKKKKS